MLVHGDKLIHSSSSTTQIHFFLSATRNDSAIKLLTAMPLTVTIVIKQSTMQKVDYAGKGRGDRHDKHDHGQQVQLKIGLAVLLQTNAGDVSTMHMFKIQCQQPITACLSASQTLASCAWFVHIALQALSFQQSKTGVCDWFMMPHGGSLPKASLCIHMSLCCFGKNVLT